MRVDALSCRDVHQQLRDAAGRVSSQLRLHFEACAPCATLAAGDGELALALTAVAPAPDVRPSEESFTRIAAGVVAERGLLGSLRARATRVRVGIVLALSVVACGMTIALLPRADLELFPMLRMLLTLAVYLVPGVWLSVAALRSLARRPSPRIDAAAIVFALVVGPLWLSLLPAAHRLIPSSVMGGGAMLWAKALPCITFGIVVSAPILFALWSLERGSQRAVGRAIAAAAAGAMFGSLALHLECHLTLPAHLLAGHAPVPLLVVAGWLVIHRGRTLAAPRSQ